jgi:hypothetical protein
MKLDFKSKSVNSSVFNSLIEKVSRIAFGVKIISVFDTFRFHRNTQTDNNFILK